MPGLVSPEVLDQIRAGNEIVDVIGAVVPLKRAGGNFVALCPFHKEKSPSFNVNPHKQLFHCYGCHVGGDVFSFIQQYENLTFIEAVRRLAERAKIPLQFDQAGPGPARALKDQLLRIHEEITQHWHLALTRDPSGEAARRYLEQRGLSQEAIEQFRLGYAPAVWDDTVKWAKAKGLDLALVERCGLIIQKDQRHYDRFRGRLMFPICDDQGRVIAFSGRVLAADQPGGKYVNSPETPLFTKSKVFYGLDKSKRALLDAQSALLCEGQLDLIACFMAGITNVVAPQGTAFTGDHAAILRRYATEAVLCFDSDLAGQTAAIRALDSLLASGLTVRVAVIPAPHDPDSFIREHGPAAFRALLAQAPGFFDFYLDHLTRQHGLETDKGQLAIVGGMAGALAKTSNPVLLDKYLQKTALRLGVSAGALRDPFKKALQPARAPAESAPPRSEPEWPQPHPKELWLLRLLLRHDETAEWACDYLELDWIQHPGVREVVSFRFRAHFERSWTSLSSLLSGIEHPQTRSLITATVTENREIPCPTRQIRDLTRFLRDAHLDRETQRLLQQVAHPATAEEQRAHCLRELETVRRFKREELRPKPRPENDDPF